MTAEKLKLASETHSAVRSRLILYLCIAACGSLMTELSSLTPEAVESMHWNNWAASSLSPVLAALIAWRAFIDKSTQRLDTT